MSLCCGAALPYLLLILQSGLAVSLQKYYRIAERPCHGSVDLFAAPGCRSYEAALAMSSSPIAH